MTNLLSCRIGDGRARADTNESGRFTEKIFPVLALRFPEYGVFRGSMVSPTFSPVFFLAHAHGHDDVKERAVYFYYSRAEFVGQFKKDLIVFQGFQRVQ